MKLPVQVGHYVSMTLCQYITIGQYVSMSVGCQYVMLEETPNIPPK